MEASSGQKSVKRVAKKQINVDTGNVAIYSYLMNGTHKLVQFQQVNYLAATLGGLNSEKLRENETTAEKKIGASIESGK